MRFEREDKDMLLIKNGRVIDPARKKERNADIVVKDGKIEKYMQKEHYLQRQKQLPIRCLMQKVLW